MSMSIRVELRNADRATYFSVHQVLENNGLSRTIEGTSGNLYHLEPAEYHLDTTLSDSEILKRVYDLVFKIHADCSVRVIEYTSMRFIGLKKLSQTAKA